MMERNRDEAILNNIGGMKIVADLADEFRVERFTLVSTDKAVDPVNIMGATKRVCELYLGKMEQESKTRFMAMRFGNVLGSNGSVVPTFMKQIEKRLPVTVTHKDMERYFMTIPEAVTLILQAMALGEGGELFMLDMGKPVRIADLAEKMIKMAGFVPGKDIPIVYTGLRPGEKLTEVLTGKGEEVHKTSHPKINKVLGSYKPRDDISKLIDGWLSSCRTRPEETAQEIIETLRGEKDETLNVIPIGKAAG
jgi:FlaA1/EpsC-like NDP-sugar epimerase